MIKFQNITLAILSFFRFFLNPSLPDISLHFYSLCPSRHTCSIAQHITMSSVLQLAISEQNYYISDLKSIMPRNSELKNNWPSSTHKICPFKIVCMYLFILLASTSTQIFQLRPYWANCKQKNWWWITRARYSSRFPKFIPRKVFNEEVVKLKMRYLSSGPDLYSSWLIQGKNI